MKVISKVCLIPVWFVIVVFDLLFKMVLKVFEISKGICTTLIIVLFIGLLIWYRQNVKLFIFLGAIEGLMFAMLCLGTMVELLIDKLKKVIWKKICSTQFDLV